VPNIYEAANGTSPHDPTSTPAANFVVDPGIEVETDTIKRTIQAAIDAAPTITADPTRYTIIEIRPGNYPENLTTYDRRVFLMAKAVAGELPVLRGATEDNDFALRISEGGIAVDGLVIDRGFGYGVVVSTDSTADQVQLVNCVIRRATTGTNRNEAAALWINQTKVRVAHCTFIENRAFNWGDNAKGIRVNFPGVLVLENSILWDTQDFGVELAGNGDVTIRNCIIRGRGGDLDPLLESRTYPSADNGILLSANSPAINAGTVLNVGLQDIHGGIRGAQPDVGADERNTADTDGDGIQDEFEFRSFGSLSMPASDDSDGDSLNLLGEFNARTNPHQADTDGDMISDGSEVANGLNPLDPADQLDDPDGDRIPNAYEAANGTSANNGASIPSSHLIVDPTIDVETATIKKTIQAAINAAPDLNADPNRWTIIQVQPGTYSEDIAITNRRILLLGSPGLNEVPVVVGTENPFAIIISQGGTAFDGIFVHRHSTFGHFGVLIRPQATNDRVQFVNCLFRGAATESGGNQSAAMWIENGSVRVAHCTFTDNVVNHTPTDSKSIRANDPASLLVENSILWNIAPGAELRGQNVTVHNSIVRAAGGPLDVDPRFEPLTGNARNWIRLRDDSPAIDAGGIISVGKRDQTGALRLGNPDLGAKENFPTDTDVDGLPDEWELWHFGSLAFGAGDDPDSDYANNRGEYFNHLDPNDPDTDHDGELDGYDIDSDSDGLNDALEILNGGNIYDPDTNHDGINDFVAYQAGISLSSPDPDGDTLDAAAEAAKGTSPLLADTDHDGVPDNLDDYPLDPTRSQFPPGDPNDHTPPEIWLDVPENAVPVP
jgi:hypothetical protein